MDAVFAVMVAVGSIFAYYMYVQSLYMHMNSTWKGGVLSLTQSMCVCVTIHLYVKNPYDRIFALYLMSAEAFDLIRYTK